jgi:SAM-dependent methyltransferase
MVPVNPFNSKMSTCNACGSHEVKDTIAAKEMMMGTGELFTYSECAACGTLSLQDIPTDYQRWYGNGYYSTQTNVEQLFAHPIKNWLKAQRDRYCLTGKGWAGKWLQKIMPNQAIELINFRSLGLTTTSRILDVGCGTGKLTYVLYNAGFTHIKGLEPFLEKDIHYSNGLTIKKGWLHEWGDSTFDIILFNHSFEHVPDPKATLLQAKKILSTAGKIYIRIPTVTSFAFETYREHWVQLDAPRHITLFSKQGFGQLAAKCGLEVKKIISEGTVFQFTGSEQYKMGIPLYGNAKSWFEGNKNIFTDAVFKSFKKRAAKLNQENHGDSIAIILSKKNKVSTSSE